jgi:cytochrome c oxidase subunit II
LKNWFLFTGDAPEKAMVVEVTGKQFSWMFRYPGKDGVLGKRYFRLIDEASGNNLGQVWRDTTIHVSNSRSGTRDMSFKADYHNFDDIFSAQTMYLVKGKPVKLIIGSRDVIHDVGLPHFRMKMDAVPGMPTTLWFTPQFTTKEMQERTGNPNFTYEIACDQMCGNGHYSMKGTIVVVTQDQFDAWLMNQKPAYLTAFPDADPNKPKPDTTAKAAQTAQLKLK